MNDEKFSIEAGTQEISEGPLNRQEEQEINFEQYLETEIFPALGLDRQRGVDAPTEVLEDKELFERSRQNIRDTITALYELDTVEGRIDIKAMEAEKNKKIGALLFSKLQENLARISLMTVEYGITVSAEDLGVTPDNLNLSALDGAFYEAAKNVRKKISESVENKINAILESGQAYESLVMPTSDQFDDKVLMRDFLARHQSLINSETNKIFDSINFNGLAHKTINELRQLAQNIPAQDPRRFIKRITREQLTDELLRESRNCQNTGFVNVNVSAPALERILSEGKFRDIISMSDEELSVLGKNERGYREYRENRKITEEALGIHNPEGVVVYGTYGSDFKQETAKGGASCYGDIFLKFKAGVKSVYTESDSMWATLSETIRKKLRDKAVGDGYAESAAARQIAPEHAAIAKAVLILDEKRRTELTSEQVSSTYLEAQILNPTLEHIESINIPKSAVPRAKSQWTEGFLRLIEQLRQDSFLGPKIVFTEA